MAEYASSGVGTAGLTTGIIGTSLAGLLALNNGDGGLLGGLLGGNNQKNEKIAALMAENTQLKSQAYTDAQVKDLNAEICNLRQQVTKQGGEIDCTNLRMNERFAALEKQRQLEQEITDCKIARVADAATCGINNLKCALDCLQQTVAGITRTYVPAGAVTPLPAPYPFPPVPPYPPFIPPVAPPAEAASSSTSSTTTGG